MKSFKELGLSENILQAIEEQGYEYPMPIQEEVIPWLLSQSSNSIDLIALAQTGTGKTAAYGLPVLQRLSNERNGYPQALILSPTRELCLQIADDLEGFANHLPHLRILAVYGGANIEPQIRALRAGVDVIVATPGRLLDLMRRGVADLSQVTHVVLDEADEMLSMGFQEDLNAILEGISQSHNTLLFSATMSKEIEQIANNYLHTPHTIQVGSRNEGSNNVNHIYYMVQAKDKYLALKRIVDYYPRIYAIIFCRTRMETQEVADNLIRDGYNADALHGELSQQQRDLTMQKFRQHRTQLLVATDVAARGLDVNDLTHVINYGMPDDTEYYNHRSGRTGRAGKKGTSICIVHVREKNKIKLIEKAIQKKFEQGILPMPKDICAKQLYHVIDEIERVEVDEEEILPFLPEVAKRWEWLDKEDLIKRVLSREFGRFLQYYANAPEIENIQPEKDKKNSRSESGQKRGSRQAEEGYTRLFLNIGKIDGQYAKEIIGLINNSVKGNKVEIGRIDLMKNFSFVEVAEEDAERVIKALKHNVKVKGRSVLADYADNADRGNVKSSYKEKSKTSKSEKKFQESSSKKSKKNKGVEEELAFNTGKKKFSKEDWMVFLNPEKAGLYASHDDSDKWSKKKSKKKK